MPMMVEKNKILTIALISLAITSCSLIDDDLDECGQDVTINYELKSPTDIKSYINQELSTESERPVAEALYYSLEDIFRNYAYDIDLSFYTPDEQRANHEVHQMNATTATYTLYLQQDSYHHIAIANEAKRGTGEAGLFTGRKDMKINGSSSTYYVPLYMANSAMALVIDLNGQDVSGIKVIADGFASDFSISDSVYTYTDNYVVEAAELPLATSAYRCFYTINYPSRDMASGNNGIWQVKLYITLPDGTVTENILSVGEPLKAGNLKILKVRLKDQGEAEAVSVNVGVSVTLDWKEGGTYEPIL